MNLNIKNQLKTYSLLILFLFSTPAMSNLFSEALTASKNDNNSEAVEIWSKLASTGNTLAGYNLAGHYSTGKGVSQNKQLSDKWLKKATRSGLVQAYLHLNKNALSPANGLQLTFHSGPLFWLKDQEAKKYTIQLASSRKEKSIKRIFDNNNLTGKGGYYRYVRNGIDRYALVYGAYNTVAAANTAFSKLPAKLRKKTPWVRKIKSIQKISK